MEKTSSACTISTRGNSVLSINSFCKCPSNTYINAATNSSNIQVYNVMEKLSRFRLMIKRQPCDHCKSVAKQAAMDPNDYFSSRKGAFQTSVKDCTGKIIEPSTDGALVASYLLTEINIWDIDKERLVLLTKNTLIVVNYDFIGLKIRDYKKVRLSTISAVVTGNLKYPSYSLIPNRRRMKGIRLVCAETCTATFVNRYLNPFHKLAPIYTFTFHPLYFIKDAAESKSTYNVEEFSEKVSKGIQSLQPSPSPSQQDCNTCFQDGNILLPNYIGFGSVIHNRFALGFYRVRGKLGF